MDIVIKRNYYFHPIGINGWPKEPVNYIAFRYDGKLQSIHHVEDYTVFTNPNEYIDEIPDDNWHPCYLYTLGKPIIPSTEVKNGKIYPSARVWCMIDTLFTCDTIYEASYVSKKRKEKLNSAKNKGVSSYVY